MAFKHIRIDDGCIACNLCQDLAPEVFEVLAGDLCRVLPRAEERASLSSRLGQRVREAAQECPVDVIVVEEAARPPAAA